MPEAEAVRRLLAFQPGRDASRRIASLALRLAQRVRATPPGPLSAESFLRHYGLSTREGVALMCVAEALLRIPDAQTADALLRDKLSSGSWGSTKDDASFVSSAADWALMLTGTLARWREAPQEDLSSSLKQLVARLGEPVARAAIRQAMRILAEQFVLAETIEEAVSRAGERRPYRFSFDMLGEAARTAEDAARYFAAYSNAIRAVAPPDSLSVKLSALHPRFEELKRDRVFSELLPKLTDLTRIAAARGVGITLDAEESERLELTLDIFEALTGQFNAGLAIQAYQKRAAAVCDWLIALGRSRKRRIPMRLVKGAYWDGEIKRAQQLGMPDYPVFTRKAVTDISYVACAAKLLAAPDAIYPAFATHNCRTVATILELCPPNKGREGGFEFQKLLGMGDALYEALLAEHPGIAVRVYAPVGSFTDLLPYLVRRLLENGANTSFVHQIADPDVPLEDLVADPVSSCPSPTFPTRASRCRATSTRTARTRSAWILRAATCLTRFTGELRSRNFRRPLHPSLSIAPSDAPRKASSPGRACPPQSAPRFWSAPPTCWRNACSTWSRSSCARAAAPMPTRCRKSAKQPTFAGITPFSPENISANPTCSRVPPASVTNCNSTAAASSPASAPGTFRSPSSPARSPPRLPRATR